MGTCFVIQPFDGGKFDKRFEDVFAPAIKAAGLEPYRVDQDPNVEVPIDAIENGISNAVLCLADITRDNPNVWYELGFAFASGKYVVMVCSDERVEKRYPFDIQHRTIIQYSSDSTQDFEKLKSEITNRIKALAEKGEAMRQLAQSEQVAAVGGLTQAEMVVLASIAGVRTEPDGSLPVNLAKQDVERAGFTPIGFAIGLRRLSKKEFVEVFVAEDQGERWEVVRVSDKGWDWIDGNEDKFRLRKAEAEPRDDDLPF